jgi:predicted DNA-binding transcriptional regulator YafY
MKSAGSVDIEYIDYSGNCTIRTVHPMLWVDSDRFTAFCELRQAERDFRVSRIVSCRAEGKDTIIGARPDGTNEIAVQDYLDYEGHVKP